MESRRRIFLEKERAADQSLEETLREVSRIVRGHYRAQEGGRLPLWGTIRSYLYHHVDGRCYRFLTDGTLASDLGERSAEPEAFMEIGGKRITPESLAKKPSKRIGSTKPHSDTKR